MRPELIVYHWQATIARSCSPTGRARTMRVRCLLLGHASGGGWEWCSWARLISLFLSLSLSFSLVLSLSLTLALALSLRVRSCVSESVCVRLCVLLFASVCLS